MWANAARLEELLARTGELASLSGKRLMKSAGLSWQALSAWKAGTRSPRADSLLALGQSLILRGERMCALGRDLIAFVQAEQEHRRSAEGSHTSDQVVLPLFQVSTDKTAGKGPPARAEKNPIRRQNRREA